MPIGRDTSITWYGHSCIEIRTPGDKVVIIDPWFQNPTSPKAPDAVDRCDVLLVTHGHFDHFGDCLMVGSRTRPVWPAMHELSLWLARNFAHKDQVIGMNQGGTVEAAGIGVTMVPAIHSSGDVYAAAESPIYFGTAVGFVLELENGFRVYHSGDTVAFRDMELIRELWRPDLVMVPIGGHFTMGPREAAIAVDHGHGRRPRPRWHRRAAAAGGRGDRHGVGGRAAPARGGAASGDLQPRLRHDELRGRRRLHHGEYARHGAGARERHPGAWREAGS
jgi:L-ascorbate metabolism protein UlaG (beta-lactamase superfamily)